MGIHSSFLFCQTSSVTQHWICAWESQRSALSKERCTLNQQAIMRKCRQLRMRLWQKLSSSTWKIMASSIHHHLSTTLSSKQSKCHFQVLGTTWNHASRQLPIISMSLRSALSLMKPRDRLTLWVSMVSWKQRSGCPRNRSKKRCSQKKGPSCRWTWCTSMFRTCSARPMSAWT